MLVIVVNYTATLLIFIFMQKIFRCVLAISMALSLSSCDDWFGVHVTEDTPDNAIDQMTVTGRILDTNGQPRKGVIVEAYFEHARYAILIPSRTDIRLKASSATDTNGCYSLPIYRKQDEFNLEDAIIGNYTAMIIKVKYDQNKPYFNTNVYFSVDVNAFWDNRECLMEDHIIYDGKIIRIQMNQLHPEADSTRCCLHCISKGPYNHFDWLFTKTFPMDTITAIPLGDDLIIERYWTEEYKDSLIFKYPDIPDVIDASYYP